MAQLVFIDGRRMGTIVPLSESNRIGSDGGNEIVIEEPGVQSSHAQITFENGAFRIASNGNAPIAVNGRDSATEDLHHGDIISVGDVTILFSDESNDEETGKFSNPKPAPAGEEMTTSVVESHIKTFENPEDALSHIKESERLTQHIETLYRFGAAVSTTLRMDDLMNVMAEQIFELCRPDRCFVFLYDDTKNLRLQKQRISEQSALKGFDRVSRTILNQAVENREAFLTKDASADQEINLAQSVVDQNIQSAMAIPMVKSEKIIGVIYLDTLTSFTSYTREDLHLMNALGTQAAMAIENVTSYNTQLEHSRKLISLGDISRRVSSYLSRSIVIREAVEGCLKLFECTKASLLLLDEGSDSLTVAHSNHIDQKEWTEIRIKSGEGLCGRVFESNKPLLVTDSSGVEDTGSKRNYDTASFLLVPIVARREGLQAESRPIGVITVSDKEDGSSFDQDDQEILTVLGSQVGIALNNARLYERATVDALTTVFTRPFFFSQMVEELTVHRVSRKPMALMMIDIDHFKQINDQYGHQAGDRILSELGTLLREKCLPLGLVARYGGEEFVFMLRMSDMKRAVKIAEELRAAIEASSFRYKEKKIPVTISVGVSELTEGDDVDNLVRRADAALYQAKNNGRNQVRKYDRETGYHTAQTRKITRKER